MYASLWMLANPDCYRCVGNMFNMGKSTLHRIFMDFVHAIQALRDNYISWPTGDLQQQADGFCKKTGMPGVVGCIDGTHISIRGPNSKNFRDSYINRKGYASIHLQAVCQSSLQFSDVFCGYPGSVHDARVYRQSPLRKHLDQHPLPPNMHLLGDTAYPLSTDLMTPYRDDGNLTAEHKEFNKILSSTRAHIERAFGLLKCKWRRLHHIDMFKIEHIPFVITSACILHNFILAHEKLDAADLEEIEADAVLNDSPIQPTCDDVKSRDAARKRNRLAGIE